VRRSHARRTSRRSADLTPRGMSATEPTDMDEHTTHDTHLARALTDLADARVPDSTPDVPARTRRSRQRPGWTFIERWFDMTTIAQRAPVARPLALIPRGLLILIALWLIIALTVAGLAIGGRLALMQAVMVPAPVTGPATNGLIAFERGGDGDIWVVEPDGSNKRPLIAGPAFEWGPVWSRDGTRIAYRSQATGDGTAEGHVFGAPTEIIVANADGTDPVTVATGLIWRFGDLDWAPDGTAVVFDAQDPTRETSCSQVPYEGCGSRAYRAATDGSTGAVGIGDPELDVRAPVWSPDGGTIAFGGGRASTIRLYLMAPDGTDVRPVSTSSGRGGDWTWADDPTWSFGDQSWSPDGTHIVTHVEKPEGPGHDVVLVAADGSGETIVTDRRIDEAGATFAVDGSIGWEARNARRPGPCCIEVLGADGVRTALPGVGVLSFSPDGRYVLTNPSIDSDSLNVVERDGTITATILDASRASGGVASWQRLAP
jgi:WD40-like Beta Propeller Repeat